MTIPFKSIPSGIRAPLFYAELDASKANTATQVQRTLIVGQMTAAGAAPPNLPVRCLSAADAKTAAGAGSMLAAMAATYRTNDPNGEMWLLPVGDAAGAVAASGTITFSGATTAVGVLSLYVAGTLLPITLSPGQSAAQVAAVVTSTINGIGDLPVTAAVAGAVVTLTARNAGLAGNDLDARFNFLGSAGGEVLPQGLGVVTTPMTGGTVEPDLTLALANLQDMAFDFIVSGLNYTATASLKALLSDATGRWSWSQQVFGHVFYGFRGTSGSLAASASALNDQHASALGFFGSPSPSWCWAAAFGAVSAASLRADPGQPLQTLVLSGILAPAVQVRFPLSIRNMLLYAGCSTFTVNPDGSVAIENAITTYVTNAAGQPDDSYLQVETLMLIVFVLRRLRTVVHTKFARVKLAADGTRVLPGSNVVTPSTIRAEIIAQYRLLEGQGMVQGSDVFAAGLIVEKSKTNPNRVDVLLPAILVNQLRVFAALFQFRLS